MSMLIFDNAFCFSSKFLDICTGKQDKDTE